MTTRRAYRNNFIERSIMGALSFLKGTIFCDEYALQPGFLQLLDARVKCLAALIFLCAVLFARNIAAVTVFYLATLIAAYASRIDVGFFLKRTWVFIPLFSLVIAIPALFGFFTPGDVLFESTVCGMRITMTRQGIDGATLFVARVITSVSCAVLLSITTRHAELLRALRALRIPAVFVMVAGMCYRYIYLLIELIEHTYVAIKSRVGGVLPTSRGQRVVAWNIASLWQRSYQLHSAVFAAMRARGYAGEPVMVRPARIRLRDWGWLAMIVFFCAGVILMEHICGGGYHG